MITQFRPFHRAKEVKETFISLPAGALKAKFNVLHRATRLQAFAFSCLHNTYNHGKRVSDLFKIMPERRRIVEMVTLTKELSMEKKLQAVETCYSSTNRILQPVSSQDGTVDSLLI